MATKRKPQAKRGKGASARKPIRPKRKSPPRSRKKATTARRRKAAASATARRGAGSDNANKIGLSGPNRRTGAQHNSWIEGAINGATAARNRARAVAREEGRLLYPDTPPWKRQHAYDNIPHRFSPPDNMPGLGRENFGYPKKRKAKT